MKLVSRLSRSPGPGAGAPPEPASDRLEPVEIRRIAAGRPERLAGFIASRRLHATDPEGNTPLHLAARKGNLVLCDLFIHAGSDPDALNHARQTPADLAFAAGHRLAAQLLSSLTTRSPAAGEARETDTAPATGKATTAPDTVTEEVAGDRPAKDPDGTRTETGHTEPGRLRPPEAEPGPVSGAPPPLDIQKLKGTNNKRLARPVSGSGVQTDLSARCPG